MPRTEIADVDRLRPHLARLALLDGTPFVLAEGLHLVWIDRVRDAVRLVDATRDGPLRASVLSACAELRRPLLRVDASWVARATRDLTVLEESPWRRKLARTSPVLRRFGRIDERWVADRRLRLDALASKLRCGAVRGRTAAGISRAAAELVAALYGPAAPGLLESCVTRSVAALNRREPSARPRPEPAPGATEVARAATVLALWFRPGDADLIPADVALALREGLAGLEPRERCDLHLSTVVRLVAATENSTLDGPRRVRWAARGVLLVACGVPVEDVERCARLGLHGELALLDDPCAARSWAAEVRRLSALPGGEALVRRLAPEPFSRGESRRACRAAVAWDVLEGARRLPRQLESPETLAVIRSALELLLGATATEGFRSALDPLPHGEDVETAWQSRLQGQIAHLGRLEAPTGVQLARLQTLRAHAAAGAPTGAALRRRLRVAAERARRKAAAQASLEARRAAIRRLVGAAPARLDAAWFEALALVLGADDRNRRHLTALLQDAASHPGAPVARSREPNRGWVGRAARHLDVDAWLAHHARTVEIDGRPYTLSTEEDPLQILRLGTPFGTCLSLNRDGSGPAGNAPAAVLLALDANQRVLYLRDGAGTIVARKRLAVTSTWTLVGYRLYVALPPRIRPAVDAAFRALCEDLSRATRAPLADSGEPERLHEGFRWDEPPVPFASPEHGALARYSRFLGHEVQDDACYQRAEALAFCSREDGDVEAAYRLQEHLYQHGPCWTSHGDWILERLGHAELTRRARAHCDARVPLLRHAARTSALEVIQAMARTRADWCTWRDGPEWVLRSRAVPGSAAAWIRLARRCAPAWSGARDTILYGTLSVMPWLLHVEPSDAREALEADLADLWKRFDRRRAESRGPDLTLAPGPWPEQAAFVDADARRAAVPRLAEHVTEPLLVQLGHEAARHGVDPAPLVREILAANARAARAPLGFQWIPDARLPETIALATDAALDAGPEACLALLSTLPDYGDAARFVERIAERFSPDELVTPEEREADPADLVRWRWLRAALGRG